MKVKYLKRPVSRVGMKILLKDIEEGDILQIPCPGYQRSYYYFSSCGGMLRTANRKYRPIWKSSYYSIDSLKCGEHWLSNDSGTVIGYIP